jgi:hypothetical protein
MIDNIIVRAADKLILKAYVWQIINQTFGLSENVRNYLADLNSCFRANENHLNLDVVSDHEIKTVLEESCLLPEYIYFFKKEESNYDGAIIESDYKKIPELFTNVRDVYYVNNTVEFIVMENFNKQIYSLFDKNGNNLLGYCHDIDLGTNDMILARSSHNVWWCYYTYTYNVLDLIDVRGNWDIQEDFDYISGSKVEIYHPDKSKNPKLIFKEEEPFNAHNDKRNKDESSNNNEFLDLPF